MGGKVQAVVVERHHWTAGRQQQHEEVDELDQELGKQQRRKRKELEPETSSMELRS